MISVRPQKTSIIIANLARVATDCGGPLASLFEADVARHRIVITREGSSRGGFRVELLDDR